MEEESHIEHWDRLPKWSVITIHSCGIKIYRDNIAQPTSNAAEQAAFFVAQTHKCKAGHNPHDITTYQFSSRKTADGKPAKR